MTWRREIVKDREHATEAMKRLMALGVEFMWERGPEDADVLCVTDGPSRWGNRLDVLREVCTLVAGNPPDRPLVRAAVVAELSRKYLVLPATGAVELLPEPSVDAFAPYADPNYRAIKHRLDDKPGGDLPVSFNDTAEMIAGINRKLDGLRDILAEIHVGQTKLGFKIEEARVK